MQTIKTTTVLFIIAVLLISFTPPNNKGLSVSYGTYGTTSAQIELILHKDFSFSYHDYSISQQSVEVSGTYILKNNKVFLHADNNVKFRDRWKIKNEGHSIVSRQGLCYYILRQKSKD